MTITRYGTTAQILGRFRIHTVLPVIALRSLCPAYTNCLTVFHLNLN